MEEMTVEARMPACSRSAQIARGYQREYLRKAKEKNIIVWLETGCGKTLIAVLLLEELSDLFPSSAPSVAIFLVPTIMLVQQQANVIEQFSQLKVGHYNHQKDGSKWDLEKWKNDIYSLEVLVMTPQILLNSLRHALINMECIKLLIFDECHHCQKGHPYAQIMEEYYFRLDECYRPRILGMTASPIIQKGYSECQINENMESLERLLDAKITIVDDRKELDALLPSPRIQVLEFRKDYESFDRLESFIKRINDCRPKEDWWDIECSNEYWKKRKAAVDKIYRDLEYCIYELGLWFARQAVQNDSTTFEYLLTEEGNNEANIDKSNGVLLRDIFRCFDDEYSKDDFEKLELASLKSEIVSNKVLALVKLLHEARFSQERCIIFVERVVAAKVLASFISCIFESVRCHYIVGGTHMSSKKSLTETVNKFRSGQINLLIATNVAEEGLDIPNCNSVIRFDMPKTLRSYIQSRGRARVQASRYIILMDRENISEKLLLDALSQNEDLIKQKVKDGLQVTGTSLKSVEDFETEIFRVEKTGATVSIHSSVQLLHFYCSTLPGDKFYNPKPTFKYSSEPDGIKCNILLPPNAVIRSVVGEPCVSKSVAKKRVCLKACAILHSKGELTDNLLPLTSSIPNECDESSISLGKSVDLQETAVPAVWIPLTNMSSSNILSLHMYMISFFTTPADREYSNFALLMQSPLPETIINIAFDLELRHGKNVFCKLEHLAKVSLDYEQISQAENYQSTLFSIILDQDLECRKNMQNFTTEEGWYLVLPMRLNQDLTPGGFEIDWKRIHELCSFGQVKHSLGFRNDDVPGLVTGTLQFRNEIIPMKQIPGLLVRTTGGEKLYNLLDVFTNLNALSPFPDPKFKNYVDYFQQSYNIEILHTQQPLLKARILREAYNCLQVRHVNKGNGETGVKDEIANESSYQSKSIVELPPEICDIIMCGLHDSIVNAAVLLPSFMQRLEGILAATQLHDFFSSQFPEGSLVSVDKVQEALTTESCAEHFSLERLELLGDSFLKFAVTSKLFVSHAEAHEGFLSSERVKKICNSSLFMLGSNCGIPRFIRDHLFDPKLWVAPCHPSKIACDESKLLEIHGEPTVRKCKKHFIACNKRHRWMQKKTVADVVEALIGAYLEDGGESAALAFMKMIGIEATIKYEEKLAIPSFSEKNLALEKMIKINAIEGFLSYKFRNKGLLIEAFTHASFTTHQGRCYQRLEFLGDSVLDFLITRCLFEKNSASKPGELTDMRSAIVNNESFARIMVEHRLYEHLIHSSPELAVCVKDFVQYTSANEHAGDWDADKCPKVLGDILEALAGAVFVDGGFNLDLTWKIFEPILEAAICSSKNKIHPVRELLELCQKYGFLCETASSGEGVAKFMYTVGLPNCKSITGTAISKDKKSAKRHAALDALKKLKALGYIRQAKSTKQTKAMRTACLRELKAREKPELTLESPIGSIDEGGCNVLRSSSLQLQTGFSEQIVKIMGGSNLQEHSEYEGDIESESIATTTAIGATRASNKVSTEARNDGVIRMEHTAAESHQESRTPGQSMVQLHETCAKRRWAPPFYECICQEGPPHDPWFTYDVNLELVDVGLVKCSGDPRKKKNAAKDSAAAELLIWLKSEGHI